MEGRAFLESPHLVIGCNRTVLYPEIPPRKSGGASHFNNTDHLSGFHTDVTHIILWIVAYPGKVLAKINLSVKSWLMGGIHTSTHLYHLIQELFQFCKTCDLYLIRNEEAEKHLCSVTKDSPKFSSDCSPQKKTCRGWYSAETSAYTCHCGSSFKGNVDDPVAGNCLA
ncbi:hypothetical protein Q5P01_011048 [Channa striata]|uniref:Uncharacterized protein n=1 Tax=Channa striata TaxID=64152 RepID=A0AA88MU16_CHASR|nr:hypothetical protein Q5P01_011048 [Channa striata]